VTSTDSSVPTPRRMVGRALHLIDLENLLADPDADCAAVDAALDAFVTAAALGADDLVALAVNHRLYRRSCFSLDRGWEIKLASGPDACDHALLAEAPVDWVADRFDRLVVGSGDGIFVDLVHGVRRRATPVWVVAQDRCLSRRLASAASRVVRIDLTGPDGTGGPPMALAA
jgi:hypothetical protein